MDSDKPEELPRENAADMRAEPIGLLQAGLESYCRNQARHAWLCRLGGLVSQRWMRSVEAFIAKRCRKAFRRTVNKILQTCDLDRSELYELADSAFEQGKDRDIVLRSVDEPRFLVAKLQSSDVSERYAAASGLVELRDTRGVVPLLENAKDAYSRNEALKLLVAAGQVTRDPLAEAVFAPDRSPEVQALATTALGRLGGKESFKPLVSALEHSSEVVRHAAAAALAEIAKRCGKGFQSTVTEILQICDLERSELYELADSAFEQGKDRDIVLRSVDEPRFLVEKLQSSDVSDRYAAASGLVELKDTRGVVPLLETGVTLAEVARADLSEERRGVVASRSLKKALKLLVAAGQVARDPLAECVFAPDRPPDFQALATTVLGRLGGKESIQPLVSALKHRSEVVRHAAATALARMAVTTPALLRQTWPLVRGDIEASTHDDGLRKSTIRSFSHHIDYCPSDCGPAHSDHMQHEDESHSDHHDRQQTLEYDNLLSVIATCPFCGERTFVFVTASDDYICPWCGKSLSLHKKYNEFSDDLYETFPGAHRERGYCEPDF